MSPTYAYDTVDNQVSVTDPLGHATTFTYNTLNRRSSTTDSLNHTTSTRTMLMAIGDNSRTLTTK